MPTDAAVVPKVRCTNAVKIRGSVRLTEAELK
jgi:hypothetical protein